MPLPREAYRVLRSAAVLYSGGLDSVAVTLMVGELMEGPLHLLTYKHAYGTFFNEWSRKHNPDLQRLLGDRVQHHLVDHTHLWNALGATSLVSEVRTHGGHWVCCLGCQQAMATHLIAHALLHNVTNAFICSSVGGEYAAMSMPITREANARIYARYGIRYNAPLLDWGVHKSEERSFLRERGVEPGWGRRRSHQGFQPICVLGFQHALDVVFDFHTTYPPDRVEAYLEEKGRVMDGLVRGLLLERGRDPDALIERNLSVFHEEEADIARWWAGQEG